MIGQAIGRYEVRGELGRGAMGAVYRAYDSNLQREVALKVIFQSPFKSLSNAKQSELLGRFQREAKIIGSLNHHAIVPIYEFGWENGEPFIVMPLMSGGSLADRLQLGPLPLDEIVGILSWLAPALDTVHQHGIIHRDLKPSNILFNEHNAVYIADFGLARLTQQTTRLSKTGVPIGTPLYISPEQARGDKDIDQRSDIYSLGAILFEMLTGQPPYRQPHPAALLYNHVYEPIPRLDELRTDLPTGSQAIIDRAMAKNPVQRYGTAGEMSAAFKAVVVATTTPKQPNPKPSPPQTRPVPSNTQPATTFFKPNQPTPNPSQPQIAPTPSNTQPATAYFKQGLAAYNKGHYDEAIVNYNQAIRLDPNYPSAHDHRGLAYYKKGDYHKAIADYDQHIRLNPNEATAYNNRGLAYDNKGDHDHAIADYDQAIHLNPNYADAYNHRGRAYYNKGDYDQAIANYDQAIRLNPNYADAYNNSGLAYHNKGDDSQAIADFDHAIRLNPNYANAYNNRGLAYHNKGDYDQAIADFDEAIRLNPNYADAYYNRGLAHYNKTEEKIKPNIEFYKTKTKYYKEFCYSFYDKAISDFNEAIRLNPTYAAAYLGRGLARESRGDRASAYSDYKKVQELNNDPEATELAKKTLRQFYINILKDKDFLKYFFVLILTIIFSILLLYISFISIINEINL